MFGGAQLKSSVIILCQNLSKNEKDGVVNKALEIISKLRNSNFYQVKKKYCNRAKWEDLDEQRSEREIS